MTLPAHWNSAVVDCAGYRRGAELDRCADCGGPIFEHSGWCADEIRMFEEAALKAAEVFRTNGYECGCAVEKGTRVDLHRDDCIHRLLLMVSHYVIGPKLLAPRGGSSYFKTERG